MALDSISFYCKSVALQLPLKPRFTSHIELPALYTLWTPHRSVSLLTLAQPCHSGGHSAFAYTIPCCRVAVTKVRLVSEGVTTLLYESVRLYSERLSSICCKMVLVDGRVFSARRDPGLGVEVGAEEDSLPTGL